MLVATGHLVMVVAVLIPKLDGMVQIGDVVMATYSLTLATPLDCLLFI